MKVDLSSNLYVYYVVLWSPEFLQRKIVSIRKRRLGSSRRWLKRRIREVVQAVLGKRSD